MHSKVNFIFPIENMNRELDWRLLLACMHARSTNRIFVGQHDVLYRMIVKTGMHGGVYVGKNLFRQRPAFKDYERYRRVKARGFLVIHLDEEGAVYDGEEDRWRYWLLEGQFDPRCLDAEDYVCTWGDFQRDFYRSLEPACAEHIRKTGHPRFELCKAEYRKYFERDVSAITDRYGEFILLNTNLGFGNNQLGVADTFSSRLGYSVENLEERMGVVARYAHEVGVIGAVIRLVNRLSIAHPDLNIVLRPHQGEDFEYYRTIFRGISNVHVVHEGPVAPWLLSCKLLIQTGCTTALEAYLADRASINYKSGADPGQNFLIIENFGVTCVSEDEVLQNVDSILRSGQVARPVAHLDSRARSLMGNFECDAISAFLEVLDEAESRRAQARQECAPRLIRRTELGRTILERLKSLVRPLLPHKQRQYQALRSHFVRFDREVIARKIRTIETMLGKRITVTFFSSELLSIETAT